MDNNHDTALSTITNSIESAVTGIPAPIRKNFFKAIGQLCTAALEIPIASLEAKASDIRAASAARVAIIEKEGENIAAGVKPPQEYIDIAASKFASKIVREQLNLDKIVLNAANDLADIQSDVKTEQVNDIEQDWLNEFEGLARLKSSEDMQLIFGKILSGELKNPGAFSRKTLHLVSQLDAHAANNFRIFLGITVFAETSGGYITSKVFTLGGGVNGLKKYNLGYSTLTQLAEHGLISTDYDSVFNAESCTFMHDRTACCWLVINGERFGVIPVNDNSTDIDYRILGISLTQSGLELIDVVQPILNEKYNQDFLEFLKLRSLMLVEPSAFTDLTEEFIDKLKTSKSSLY